LRIQWASSIPANVMAAVPNDLKHHRADELTESLAKNLEAVVPLIEAGYADNLLFSSDFANASDLKRNGGAGYAKTVTVFAPKLRAAGVDERTLHRILVDNPRRFLAFIPKTRRSA
jgi:predicted metal-dependent phosphotriesterase family hydrolase